MARLRKHPERHVRICFRTPGGYDQNAVVGETTLRRLLNTDLKDVLVSFPEGRPRWLGWHGAAETNPKNRKVLT